jgi:hypothetical protein
LKAKNRYSSYNKNQKEKEIAGKPVQLGIEKHNRQILRSINKSSWTYTLKDQLGQSLNHSLILILIFSLTLEIVILSRYGGFTSINPSCLGYGDRLIVV